jgi:hypothetical protein
LNNLQRALHASLACQVIHDVGSDPSTMNGGPQACRRIRGGGVL